MTFLILALVGVLALSFFIIRDVEKQLSDVEFDDDDVEDPTTTCWDHNHTEHDFD